MEKMVFSVICALVGIVGKDCELCKNPNGDTKSKRMN